MYGAHAVATSDVWVVGRLSPSSGDMPLALHFDGSSWTQVAVPLPVGSVSGSLGSVTGTSSSDVWAVGRSVGPGPASPFIVHWDGTVWSVVPSATTAGASGLSDVVAISPSDAWVVGSQSEPDPDHLGTNLTRTLTEHWDGVSWSVVPSPNHPGSNVDIFMRVAASSSSNVWAIGQWNDDSDSPRTWGNSIERWDGSSWRIVKHPFGDYPIPGGDATAFWDVAALSDANVWFAGYYVTPKVDILPVLEHWDGSAWQDVEVHASGDLIDIVAASSQDMWMLGTNPTSTTSYGEHWDGTKLSEFPQPPGRDRAVRFREHSDGAAYG